MITTPATMSTAGAMLTGPVNQRGNRDHADEQHATGEVAGVQCPARQIPGRVSEGP